MITTQPDGRRWLALAVLSLSMLITVVDTTIVNVALPTLAARLHASPSSLEWIVDAYTLSFAALLLPAGSTGDRIGRHRALAAGMAIFGAASLGAALSSAAPELTAWRAVMGAGAALVIPASLAIITGLFAAGPERARAIAVWSGVSGLGVAIGPTLGGWLLAHYAWGSIFAVNVPIAVLALIGGWFAVPASTALAPRRFDPGGTVLAAVSFGLLTYTIIEAGTAGWASGRTVGRWVASALLVAAFVAWEARAAQPMIEFDIFRDPRFAVASAAVAILFFGLAGVTFMLTQIYQFILGYSPLAAGVRSLPSALALAIAVPAGTRLAARAGIRTAVTTGLLAMTAGLAYLALATGQSTYLHYVIAATVMAVGTGLTSAPATQSVLASLPPDRLGAGSAVNNTMRNLGSVLGVAVLGSLAATCYSRDMAAVHGIPRPAVSLARPSIGAATLVASHLRAAHAAEAHAVHLAAAAAFVHGASLGVLATAGLTVAAATATALLLPADKPGPPLSLGSVASRGKGKGSASPENPQRPLTFDVSPSGENPP
jgi:EmrB/QacA subfamily drug resistance transporter